MHRGCFKMMRFTTSVTVQLQFNLSSSSVWCSTIVKLYSVTALFVFGNMLSCNLLVSCTAFFFMSRSRIRCLLHLVQEYECFLSSHCNGTVTASLK